MRILRRILFLLLTLGLQTAAAGDDSVTIGLIGDSTVATKYGWGPAFENLVNKNVEVLHYAKNGATLETLSGRLDELLEHKPDYVLIQFGHNDQKKYDTAVYSEKLQSYVDRIKDAGGKPIILSSVTRRFFDEDGKILPREDGVKSNLSYYAKAAQAVAEKEEIPFIDLYAISVIHHNEIGPEASAAYNFEETDTTHFSPEGAEAIANLIAGELKRVVPAFEDYLK